jgi:hypothetical protein
VALIGSERAREGISQERARRRRRVAGHMSIMPYRKQCLWYSLASRRCLGNIQVYDKAMFFMRESSTVLSRTANPLTASMTPPTWEQTLTRRMQEYCYFCKGEGNDSAIFVEMSVFSYKRCGNSTTYTRPSENIFSTAPEAVYASLLYPFFIT